MSDHKTSQTALAQGMTDEILEVIYKYHESVPLVLALGVLEVVKQQLIGEHTETEEDE
jgi:septum formation topological specificity factor MinE